MKRLRIVLLWLLCLAVPVLAVAAVVPQAQPCAMQDAGGDGDDDCCAGALQLLHGAACKTPHQCHPGGAWVPMPATMLLHTPAAVAMREGAPDAPPPAPWASGLWRPPRAA